MSNIRLHYVYEFFMFFFFSFLAVHNQEKYWKEAKREGRKEVYIFVCTLLYTMVLSWLRNAFARDNYSYIQYFLWPLLPFNPLCFIRVICASFLISFYKVHFYFRYSPVLVQFRLSFSPDLLLFLSGFSQVLVQF